MSRLTKSTIMPYINFRESVFVLTTENKRVGKVCEKRRINNSFMKTFSYGNKNITHVAAYSKKEDMGFELLFLH